ncbi:MAG: VOC family protein [Acidobacteriota bacterium]
MSLPEVGALILFASDLDRTLAFYRALGMPLEAESHDSGPVHHAGELGPVHVAIFEGEPDEATAHRHAGSTMVGFAVDSVDAAVDALRNLGAEITQEPADYPWGRRALVVDPDGRTVELFERRSPA